MSQHDLVIDNGPGAAVRADMNAAIAALVSQSSGPTEPVVTYAGQFWLDTTVVPNGALKMRNQANSGWVTVMPNVDVSGKILNVSNVFASNPSIAVPAGAAGVRVEGVGGGGAGGGIPSCTINDRASGAGGGSGAYGITPMLSLAGVSTVSVTIGAGGVGTNTSGPAGSNTVVTVGATTLTFGGGGGGGGMAAMLSTIQISTATVGGQGGTAVGLPAGGAYGANNLCNSSQALSGQGGGTPFGAGGGALRYTSGAPTASNGDAGAGYGSGGGGACIVNIGAPSGRLGGNGATGLVRLHWYYGRV